MNIGHMLQILLRFEIDDYPADSCDIIPTAFLFLMTQQTAY